MTNLLRYREDDASAPWLEEDLQMAVVRDVRRLGLDIAADQNGSGKRSKRQAGRLKVAGLVAGEPDLRLYQIEGMDKAELTTVRFGYCFAVGMMRAIGLWICVPLLAYTLVRGFTGFDIDDSDKSGWKRSGARIVTDYKTGLQYFAAQGGGITPRLNPDGSHMQVKP